MSFKMFVAMLHYVFNGLSKQCLSLGKNCSRYVLCCQVVSLRCFLGTWPWVTPYWFFWTGCSNEESTSCYSPQVSSLYIEKQNPQRGRKGNSCDGAGARPRSPCSACHASGCGWDALGLEAPSFLLGSSSSSGYLCLCHSLQAIWLLLVILQRLNSH